MVSGRQRPPQHSLSTAQGYPSPTQSGPSDRQRSRPAASAAQVSPAQQSEFILHTSPSARQCFFIIGPGMPPQRATPGGATVHAPEQQSFADAQRSCAGRQPVGHEQRRVPSLVGSHRPEQQSLSFAQISSAG